jgi:hypothetical protein
MTIHFFCVATEYTTNLVRLQKQFTFWGYQLHVVGLRDPRVTRTGWSLSYKLTFLKEWLQKQLKENKVAKNDLVVCLDSNDVLLNFPVDANKTLESQIKEKFDFFQCDILFSGHCCLGEGHESFLDPKLKTERLVGMCSGMFCGKVEALLFYLQKFPFNFQTDDEDWWMCRYRAQFDIRWNENPETPTILKPKFHKLFVELGETKFEKTKIPPFPKSLKFRIAIEYRGDLFYNAAIDTISFYSQFQWNTSKKQWFCPLNAPYSGFRNWFQGKVIGTPPRVCNPERESSLSAPLFLHFEGKIPKYCMFMFSRKLCGAYHLNQHDSKQDSIFWEATILFLVILVLLLFVILLKSC